VRDLVVPFFSLKTTEELDEGAAVPIINQFTDTEFSRVPAVADSMPESRGSVFYGAGFPDVNSIGGHAAGY
jgi:hypothetical protein